MAVISKGITLKLDDKVLTNLQEIPDLGGEAEAIEVTVLTDAAHMYTNGILNYGDSLAFKFLYESTQFVELQAASENDKTHSFVVTLPDDTSASFNGTCSVKLDGVGVNAALTYTLFVKPTSTIGWVEG